MRGRLRRVEGRDDTLVNIDAMRSVESANYRGFIDGLEEVPQALALRAAINRIGWIIDVEVQILREKLRKVSFGLQN